MSCEKPLPGLKCTKAQQDYQKKYREDNKVRLKAYRDRTRSLRTPDEIEAKKIYLKEWYSKNKIWKKEYQISNREYINEYHRNYRKNHSHAVTEERREYSRIYYHKHKEVMKMRQKWQRTWRIHNNPAYYNDLLLIDPTLFS